MSVYRPITSPLNVLYQQAPREVQQQISKLPLEEMQAYVFYLANCLQPGDIAKLITHVPQVAINGDDHIVLQNGDTLRRPRAAQLQEAGLLDYVERRKSRKKVMCAPLLPTIYFSKGCEFLY